MACYWSFHLQQVFSMSACELQAASCLYQTLWLPLWTHPNWHACCCRTAHPKCRCSRQVTFSQQHQLPRVVPLAAAPVRQAGPSTPEPDYRDIDGQPSNQVVMALFRRKMVQAIGNDSQLTG